MTDIAPDDPIVAKVIKMIRDMRWVVGGYVNAKAAPIVPRRPMGR